VERTLVASFAARRPAENGAVLGGTRRMVGVDVVRGHHHTW